MTNFKLHWLNPKIEPRPTPPPRGDGLFAKSKLKKGDCLIMIGGYILTVEEESRLPGKNADNGVQIAKDLVLCTVRPEEYGGVNYLNHSCEPNASFNAADDFVAMRATKPGEELFWDYGFAESNPKFRMKCRCGAIDYRDLITGADWQHINWDSDKRQYFSRDLRRLAPKPATGVRN